SFSPASWLTKFSATHCLPKSSNLPALSRFPQSMKACARSLPVLGVGFGGSTGLGGGGGGVAALVFATGALQVVVTVCLSLSFFFQPAASARHSVAATIMRVFIAIPPWVRGETRSNRLEGPGLDHRRTRRQLIEHSRHRGLHRQRVPCLDR